MQFSVSTWTSAFSIGRYRCWYRGNYYRYRYETDTGSIGRYSIPDTGIGLSLYFSIFTILLSLLL